MRKLQISEAAPVAESLKSVNAKSARLYRIAGFWCFRVVCEDGSVKLGTAYTPEAAMAYALGFEAPAKSEVA